LRGLAAASVVLLHLLSVFLGTSFVTYRGVDLLMGILSRTPLQALWGGGQAVTLFFILSGFALHRMLFAQPMRYFAFASRRIIRLWIPYFMVVTISVIALHLAGTHRIVGQSSWMNSLLGTMPTEGLVLRHLLAIGDFDTRPIDFVIWSLVQEFRLSLLFPIIFWAVNRFPWARFLAGSVALSLLATAMMHFYTESQVSLLSTAAAQLLFVIGALLSRHEKEVQQLYARTSRLFRVLLFVVASLAYSNCLELSSTYSPVVGGTLILVFALCSQIAIGILSRRFAQWLGAISYSLYLCHGVILLLLINLAYPRWSFFEIVAAAGPLSLIAAMALYQWVERPAIRLSRAIGQRLQPAFPQRAEIAS
jgi:peptidoglycan/LPS O-acetylase OafA/YrhL